MMMLKIILTMLVLYVIMNRTFYYMDEGHLRNKRNRTQMNDMNKDKFQQVILLSLIGILSLLIFIAQILN
jgi:hypothetical protein